MVASQCTINHPVLVAALRGREGERLAALDEVSLVPLPRLAEQMTGAYGMWVANLEAGSERIIDLPR